MWFGLRLRLGRSHWTSYVFLYHLLCNALFPLTRVVCFANGSSCSRDALYRRGMREDLMEWLPLLVACCIIHTAKITLYTLNYFR